MDKASVLDELKQLSEETNKAFTALKDINDKYEASATREQELKNNLEKANEDIQKYSVDQAKLLKRLDDFELRSQRPNLTPGEENQDDRDKFNIAFRTLLKENTTRSLSQDQKELLYTKRALNETIDSEGGILAPSVFEKDILRTVYDTAVTRPLADVRATQSKESQILTLGAVATAWGHETEAYTEQEMDTGAVKISIEGMRLLVKVSDELLEDSTIDLFSELSSAFAEAIAQEEDRVFILGDGVKKPVGILAQTGGTLVNSLNVVNSGVAAALTDNTHNGADALIDAQYAVKGIYRNNGTWMFNSNTERIIRKFKDLNGNYLWQPAVTLGSPNTFGGRPIANNESMPDIAANAYPILFGDFKRALKIRDRVGLTITKLIESFATTGQIGFRIRKRLGSRCVLPKALSTIKIAA